MNKKKNQVIGNIFKWLAGVLLAASVVTAQEQVEPLERIGIRAGEDGARFILVESGTPFFVKGFNYVRLRGDHATFDADTQSTKAHYDPARAEAMFRALREAGHNTVRVFIIGRSKANPGIAGDYDTTKTLHEPYMENVLDFLRRATRHGIRVFPTFGDGGVPLNAYYREKLRGNGHNKNVFVLTKEGMASRTEHLTSFLSYIKEKEPALLPTLLGLQCQNEAYLRADQWPFTEKEGAFTAPNGKTYDLSKTAQRQALMNEGYQHYHERMVAAVQAVDAGMLVAEGVFVPRAVGKDPAKHAGVWPGKTSDERYPPTLTTLGAGALDFLDVHFYRTNGKESVDQAFRLNLGSTGFFTPEMAAIRKEKPVIMGEFGAFDSVEKTFEEAVESTVRIRDLALEAGVNGMLFWTYDCFEQARLHHAASDWPLFVRKMGDFEKPDNDRQTVVTIEPLAPTRSYDRMIFGGFLEHFDNQIYGGVFEPGSPLADEAGFRTDVLDALKELKMPVIRWPGGCFVDAYHWQKGVGEKREPYGDFRWGVIEPNTFGTDEFVELCRRLGAEPYICFNGLASPQENLDWVAYCNATEGKFAEMRKANGHPEPLKVKFWSVGNERYDKEYIHRVRDTAKEMKRLYPDLLITCSGAQDGMKGVHEYLMEQAGAYLDYVSIHSYALNRGNELPRYDYLTAITTSEESETFIASVAGSLQKRNPGGRIKIAYDEWNLRAWQHPGFPRNKVDDYDAPAVRDLVGKRQKQNDQPDQYTMADALFAASFLNACLRHSDTVTMANIAPLVNTRGPIFAHEKGIVKRPHYHTMWMYAKLLQERVANVQVTAGDLRSGETSVDVIDAIATVDQSGRQWSIALINRHPTEKVSCTLEMKSAPLDGIYQATLLSADSVKSYNDIEHPNRVAPKEVELTFNQGAVDLPPHSLIIVQVPLK